MICNVMLVSGVQQSESAITWWLRLIPGSGRSPGEGNGNPLRILPRKSHGQRSLTGYSSWGCKELDTTERLHFTSLQDFSIYMCFFNCLNCICSFFSLILFIFSLSNHKPELCPFFPPGSFDFLCKVNIQEKHEYSGLCNFQKN